ncbi:hypothetical protein L596_015651 [Steinernema carpocapsae]|uniref:Uncharacterized protein n=1 Tax=Steinernema carpocapsae TaxID=34508 RepID=A0A4U5NGK6_STECR|nr:hypothetical protein L596_015651 [Steinernema carpocapsae]
MPKITNQINQQESVADESGEDVFRKETDPLARGDADIIPEQKQQMAPEERHRGITHFATAPLETEEFVPNGMNSTRAGQTRRKMSTETTPPPALF